MLTHLQIRNFIIVEALELDLAPGMSAMTGETGAGKSILVDALGLLLGDRADSSIVRQGTAQADIGAVFALDHLPAAKAWLEARDLDSGDECLLRRVISRQGRSRAYINGTVQPLQALKQFGELLVDIHGQHEHQSLLRRDAQRQLLDDYAGNLDLLAELKEHYRHWHHLRQTLELSRQAGDERDARLDLLRYQVRELEMLGLKQGELSALEAEHPRLANAERLLETCRRTLGWLYEDEPVSVHSLLSHSLRDVEGLLALEPKLAPVGELLNTALIQVREASDELRHYGHGIEIDPQRLAWVEQRLADVQALARKHRVEPEKLPGLLKDLRDELEQIDTSESRQKALEQELEQTLRSYSNCAARLSERRAGAALALATRIGAVMESLGMPGGRCEIALEPLSKPSPNGLETVDLLISMNPGQPLKPLIKVASGGELSRISLAIQVIAAQGANIPTLIFDEVDTGIGGGVAEVVGRRLRALGDNRQVLCVTHLPQVAAQAHQQLRISKYSDGETTCARVAPLDAAGRVEEIARMLGGLELTDKTRLHAREMITRAQRE